MWKDCVKAVLVCVERLCEGGIGMCGKIPAEWLSSAYSSTAFIALHLRLSELLKNVVL